ncbi:hypothetical protein WR25_20213 [Diploscapter pachys]|uniref:Uncharacterized protein n=1 Tax=Diploscapter pachys TaxID=2018661 RepID=A0A2A2K5U2_9BILA|nr:hypothetical protein WR25_20213 [Diploscapter pachys]
MVDRDEIVAVHLGTHLDADIVHIVDIPCRRMADHLAIGRLHDLRTLPERLGQRREAERRVKGLALLHHANGIIALRLQQIAGVIAQIARPLGRDEIRDDIRVVSVASSVAAPGVVGAGRPTPFFSRSSLRLVS